MNNEYSERDILAMEHYEYNASAKYEKACDELDAILNI